MPRPSAAQTFFDFAPATQGGIQIHRTPTEVKLEVERKKREKLLRDIAKKRAACRQAEEHARDEAARTATRADQLQSAFRSTLDELKAIMAQLLGEGSPLGKRDRARVRRLYGQVVPEDDPDEVDASPFDFGEGGAPFPGAEEGQRSARQDEEAGPSASKPSGDRASRLRQLFRRLATALHPDKVRAEGEKETRTRVMKEVTRAYESGDLARLVELERDWLAAPAREADDEAVARQLAELLEENRALRRQLRELTAELKSLRTGFAMPGRPESPAGGVPMAMDGMLDRLEWELAHLQTFRDCAQRVAAGEMSVTEFLSGPPEDEEPLEDLLSSALADLLDQAFSEPAPRPRPRPRGAKKKKKKKKRSRTRGR